MNLPTRYTILRSLGTGSQGEVFLAVDRYRADSMVALKLLRADAALSTHELTREFLTLSRLHHPNIARVRDFGQTSERSAFFTTDYISGGNLLDWVAECDPSTRWSCLIQSAGQALSALDYLSRRGMSHGDVKPANLLVEILGPDRELDSCLKLIDFGTARRSWQTRAGGAAAGGEPLRSGDRSGTPAYLPPAELLGDLSADARIDLYALGMSLFHAAAGRLPFRLGDRAALAEWWRSKKHARLHSIEPDAPPVLDALVSRLTTIDRGGTFETAAEALDFLRSKVALRSPGRHDHGPRMWLPTRERCMDELLDAGLAGRFRRPQLILGPPGSGKRTVLEALVSRLQIRGLQTILFRGLDDAAALGELRSVASELSGSSLSRHATSTEEPVDILCRLRSGRIALLLSFDAEDFHDEHRGGSAGSTHPASRGHAFFQSLVRNFRDAPSPDASRSLPFFCAATSEPDRLCQELATSLGQFDRRHLEPLSNAAIEEVSREYFMVETVPESILARVARESDGHPEAVLEALESLHAVGVRADSLGHLKLPPRLPERLVPERRERCDVRRLDPETRRALGRLALTRDALSASELARRVPSASQTRWQSFLEELHLKGFCRLVASEDALRFQLRAALSARSPSNILDDREEREARRELSRYFSGGRVRDFEGRLAALRNEMARGRSRAALSLVTSLASILLRRGREEDLIELFTGLCDLALPSLASHRRLLALRLRAAQSFLRGGRYDSALEALGERAQDDPRWFQRHAQKLKAKVHEARGRTREAISELRWLLDQEKDADGGAGLASSVLRFELHALLAPLLYQSGEAAAGRAHLDMADDGFELCAHLPPGLRDLAAGRVLSLFASSLAVHGDLATSARFLEEALRLLRDGAREDLLRDALNELGILHVRRRSWRDALEVFREAEALARRAGDRLAAMRATYNQAVTHYRLDDLRQAEDLFHRARSLSDDLGVHAFATTIWLGFAGVLRERGRFLDAVRLYRRVLRRRAEARPGDRTLAHNNLAEIYLQLGRLGKSLHHSRQALGLARQTDSRFLLALTTCLHGVIHGALGNHREARSLIEEAEGIASAQGDPRPAGFCQLSLGRLALSQGALDVAVRHLRRGVASSRAAADRVHLYLGMMELSSILVARGKRATGLRWLPRFVRAHEEGGFSRGRLCVSILALKLDPRWPDNGSRLVGLCRDALDRGELWETFLALQQLLPGQDLSGKVRAVLMLERETLVARLTRRMPPEFRADFDRFWELAAERPEPISPGDAAGDRTADSSSADDSSPDPASAARTSLLEDSLGPLLQIGDDDVLPALLAEFKPLLGARTLTLVELRSGAPHVLHVSSDGETRRRVIREIASERAEALRRASATSQLVEAAPYLLLGLPGERPPRVVCIEQEDARTADPSWRTRLSRTARLLVACAIELQQSRAGLRQQSAALTETRAEIRRLNAVMTRSASELETALLTHRLEMRAVQMELETQGLRSRRPRRTPVGASERMRAILNQLPRIAREKHPVLLLGESGVGKDLLARWIHELGPRRDLPYVAEVCNVSETLVEAELFGFEKGAFTDAVEDRQGLFQRVAGGSIYLDEVTEISPRLQAKILRVLEEKRVRRVGGGESIPVDFRILASSRQPARRLEDGVLLRKDLYYRLNTEVIEIPPLRDRTDDLPVLVDEILTELTAETGSPRPYIHAEVMDAWRAHSWPGNIRELENQLQRLLLDRPHEITVDSIAAAVPSGVSAAGSSWMPPTRVRMTDPLPSLRQARLATEKELVLRALEFHRGNASRAAKTLQVTRRHLGSLIDKHGIDLESIKRAQTSEPSTAAEERTEERENASPSRRSPPE